jgi:hypothetical protein
VLKKYPLTTLFLQVMISKNDADTVIFRTSSLGMTEFASTPLSMQNERTYNFAQLVCPRRVRDYYLSICDALERCHFVK